MALRPTDVRQGEWTVDTYQQLPVGDGIRYEVFEGVLYMSPSPAPLHQHVLLRLAQALANYLDERPLGTLFPNLDVVLSHRDIAEPDLVFVSRERAHLIGRVNIEGAADLVVEILSPNERPGLQQVKFRRYAELGVDEYWVVNPAARTVEAFRLDEGVYIRTGVWRDEEVFRPTRFPGLALPLGRLWHVP